MSQIIPPFWTSILIFAGINGIIAMGMYFSNSGGALSVAHGAIAGMAGYLAAVMTTNFGLPFAAAMAGGAVLGFLTGILLALVTLRMAPLVAGLTTLAFGEIMVVVAYNIDYIGGARSFTGIPFMTNLETVYVLLAGILFVSWRFDGSRLGYAARACRDDSVAAAAMGIDVPRVKIMVFALGAAVAGLGGVLSAHYTLVQNPGDMGFWRSMPYLIFWAFGGSYHFLGPLFGAFFLSLAPEALRFSVYERYILYGLVLSTVTILRPEGIIRRRRPRVISSDTQDPKAVNAA